MRTPIAVMLIASVLGVDARAQVPKEKVPEFVATGAVVTFDELCLKVYTDYEKSETWMAQHSGQENVSTSGDAYREEKTDRVFLVGSELASFVVAFGKNNRCTVYSMPADRSKTEQLLNQLMDGYASAWNTKFKRTQDEVVRGREHAVAYEADIAGTDKPILVILVSYISTDAAANPLVKISAVSLKRLQSRNKAFQSSAPKDGATLGESTSPLPE